MISVALRPEPHVVDPAAATLSAEEMRLLTQWVKQNLDTLVGYWNGDLYTEQVLPALKPVTR